MKGQRKPTRADERVHIVLVSATEQARRVQQAIARRAYQLFERRGGAAWHELEDWRKAESEVVLPCCGGQMKLNGKLWLGADASCFEAGTIEIWVAPRRLTFCGRPSIGNVRATCTEGRPELVYRAVDLPLQVETERVTTRFHGSSLEIILRQAQQKEAAAMSVAV